MATATVFFVLAIVFGHDDYTAQAVGTGGLILTIVGFAILTAGGTIGGSITYVHGMRVLNLVDEPALKAMVPSTRPGEGGGLERLREPEVGLEPTAPLYKSGALPTELLRRGASYRRLSHATHDRDARPALKPIAAWARY